MLDKEVEESNNTSAKKEELIDQLCAKMHGNRGLTPWLTAAPSTEPTWYLLAGTLVLFYRGP